MADFKYLIVGGGMTAAAAVAGIREVDHDGSIGIIGTEAHPPYNRPPLTKALWKGDPLESIWRKIEGPGITMHAGRTVQKLDAPNKRVTDDQGASHGYTKLLLATGCTPRRLPFPDEVQKQLIYYRTLDDYERLRAQTQHGQRFAIIGGGFIGSELGASLTMNGKQVVMIFPDAAIGGRMYPPELATFLNGYYREKGVEILSGAKVTGAELRDGKLVLKVEGEQGAREITADGVIAGIGVVPNVTLAEAAGLKVDNGIRVNSDLQTSDPNIYAAGDVASFHNPALNQWMRVEHEDNANTMGGMAGNAMAGCTVSYDHLPLFYSDLFDLGYEAIGEVDARLQMVADWKTPFREGVVYYLRDERVRGALLWNVWGQVDAARALIASPGPHRPENLKGRLPA